MNSESLEVEHSGMTKSRPPEPCIVVIFGASGDLTHKELVPSLYALGCKNLLPQPSAIIGFARQKYTDESFREDMKNAVNDSPECGKNNWDDFAKNLYYVVGDFTDDADTSYKALLKKIRDIQSEYDIPDNVLFHLATPPSFYGTIIQKLSKASLSKSRTGWRRVIIEKPFGWDEESARELDKEIHEVFAEDQIYRVDHFLGKESVQNMLVFRFANPGFEPIWNRNYIDNIQITVSEDIGINTRGSFYEKTGILRDMVQNHLLQLLCMAAIEPPVNFDAYSLRTETIKVLDSFCEIDPDKDVILGQYDAGEVKGEKVSSYRKEDDVDPDSTTPTYAAFKITLDNWRWAGVPFYLRTGKRMNRKLSEVTIKFKPTPHLMFPVNKGKEKEHNILTFRLQPDEGIIYRFTAKQPGAELKLRPVNLNFRYDTAFGINEIPSAYQWLLYDAMKGDQTLFPRAEWIYKAWQIVDPIIKRWNSRPWMKFPNYKAGTWGPDESLNLLAKDGRKWQVL